ncbi:MAG: Gfo/Idh/MocA family oxidoreductase [Ferruginibacter sp.]
MHPLRFGIIGCGRIAVRHAAAIQKKGYLTAVCDIIPEKADALAAGFAAAAYYSIEGMLQSANDIDVMAICTPNGLHAGHSILCLEKGFHVLCEKPMALQATDAARMIAAATKKNRHLFIVKQNRFNPPVQAVKKLLEEQRLGKIYSIQVNCFWNRSLAYYADAWRGTKDLDGGTLYTQFSHFIDLLYWFFGDVQEVRAVTANFAHQEIIAFEDTGIVTLQFTNGIIGSLHYTVNAYRRNMEGSITIFGEKGTVKIGGQYLNELEYQCIEDFSVPVLPAGNPPNQYGNYEGSMSNHDKVYDNVLAVLQQGAAITTTAADGMKTVEIIEKIYAAASRLN